MLNDKVIIITGAAQGMGEVHAFVLAEKGATVILTDLDAVLGQNVVTAIRASGGKADYFQHDVSSEFDWQQVIASVTSRYRKVDALVNRSASSPAEEYVSQL